MAIYLFIYLFFAVLHLFLGSWFYPLLFLWFSAFLLFCFSASLLFLLLCFSCFSAFLLFAFPASLLFCFSVFPASFYFYYSTFSFLQSCDFAAPLPAPLLPCFLSLLYLCFSLSFALFILFCLYPKWNPRETLGETQRNPKEILIRNPTWSPKWTLKKP